MADRDTEHVGADKWNGDSAVQRFSERRESSIPQHLKHVESRISNLEQRISEGKGLSEYVARTEIGMYEKFRARIERQNGWVV